MFNSCLEFLEEYEWLKQRDRSTLLLFFVLSVSYNSLRAIHVLQLQNHNA